VLRSGEMEVLGRLPYASNSTLLVRCCDSSREVLAVYKPALGARPLSDFDVTTLPAREVAAYLLSQALGWGLVPATVLREDGPLGPGSLQVFVEHDREQHYFSLLSAHRGFFKRLATFDVVCNNADRKAGHCLLDTAGRIWAIDNSLTFHTAPKLRTVIWDFAGEQVLARDRRGLARLARELVETEFAGKLQQLLSRTEIVALKRRITLLAAPCTLPHPDSDWSFPWPLV
jgi:hypothetical protein